MSASTAFLSIRRAADRDLTYIGIFAKAASPRTGFTIATLSSFNVAYGGNGREFNVFRNPSDLAADTPVFQLGSDGTTAANSGLRIGVARTPIRQHLSAQHAVTFSQWSGIGCQDQTVSVPGARDGDSVSVGVPAALADLGGMLFTALHQQG